MTRRDLLSWTLLLPFLSQLVVEAETQEKRADLVIAQGPHLSYFGLRPFFVRYCNTPFNGFEKQGDLTPVFDFGIEPKTFRSLVDAVAVRIYRLPHEPGRPIEETVAVLNDGVSAELTLKGIAEPSLFLKQWMMCEAICAYVTSKVAYDFEFMSALSVREKN